MDKWEYKLVVPRKMALEGFEGDQTKHFNDLGSEGWELVTGVYGEGLFAPAAAGNVVFVFKRRVEAGGRVRVTPERRITRK